MKSAENSVWTPVSSTLLYVIYPAILIRILYAPIFSSGFDWLPANVLDGRLLIGITEHWYLFFTGEAPWRTLLQMYPVQGSLGFSDAFFLYGIPHAGLRALGVDRYTAWQIWILIFPLVGFYGFHLYARRFLKIRRGIALFFAGLFIFSAQTFNVVNNSHMQLLALWFVPWMVIPLHIFVERVWREDSRILFPGSLFLILYAMIAYTSFYTIWYFSFGVLLFLTCYLALIAIRRESFKFKSEITFVALRCSRFSRQFIVLGALFISCMLPFFMTYLPVYLESGGRAYGAIVSQQPSWYDLINPGGRNWLWGSVFALPIDHTRDYFWELSYGFPPLTFLVCLCGAVLAWGRSRRSMLIPAAVLSIVLYYVLVMRFGEVSLWRIVHASVPGAGTVRAVGRVGLFMTFPVFVIAAIGFNRGIVSATRRSIFIAVASVLAGTLIFVEQVASGEYTNPRISKAKNHQLTKNIETPPEGMEAFYIREMPPYEYNNVEAAGIAFRIAQQLSRPTLNGFSGIFPDGYELYERWGHEDYLNQVDKWIERNGLKSEGIYGLRLPDGDWAPFDRSGLYSYSYGDDIIHNAPMPFSGYAVHGWSDIEEWGVWSDGDEAILRVAPRNVSHRGATIEISAVGFVTMDHQEQNIDLFVNGELVEELRLTVEDPERNYEIPIPAGAVDEETVEVKFVIHNAISPKSLGMSDDGRALGIGLKRFVIRTD